jgi:hypothetical protein
MPPPHDPRLDLARRTATDVVGRLGITGVALDVVRVGTSILFASTTDGMLVRVEDRGDTASARRQVTVGRYLAECGVPAVVPLDDIDQPVVTDTGAVTLWRLEQLVPGEVDPATLGALARHLHGATTDAGAGAGLPTLDPLGAVRRQLATAGVSTLDDVVADLATRWSGFATVMPTALVHGDLHPGNVLMTRRGPVLADLELAGVGPVAYDLVPAVVAVQRYGEPARSLAEYARAYGQPIAPAARHGVLRDTYEMWLTAWALANRHLDARHDLEARRRLARWTPVPLRPGPLGAPHWSLL